MDDSKELPTSAKAGIGICVVICFNSSMVSIYFIIKILKEDAYDRGTYVYMYAFVCGTYVHAHV